MPGPVYRDRVRPLNVNVKPLDGNAEKSWDRNASHGVPLDSFLTDTCGNKAVHKGFSDTKLYKVRIEC